MARGRGRGRTAEEGDLGDVPGIGEALNHDIAAVLAGRVLGVEEEDEGAVRALFGGEGDVVQRV